MLFVVIFEVKTLLLWFMWFNINKRRRRISFSSFFKGFCFFFLFCGDEDEEMAEKHDDDRERSGDGGGPPRFESLEFRNRLSAVRQQHWQPKLRAKRNKKKVSNFFYIQEESPFFFFCHHNTNTNQTLFLFYSTKPLNPSKNNKKKISTQKEIPKCSCFKHLVFAVQQTTHTHSFTAAFWFHWIAQKKKICKANPNITLTSKSWYSFWFLVFQCIEVSPCFVDKSSQYSSLGNDKRLWIVD